MNFWPLGHFRRLLRWRSLASKNSLLKQYPLTIGARATGKCSHVVVTSKDFIVVVTVIYGVLFQNQGFITSRLLKSTYPPSKQILAIRNHRSRRIFKLLSDPSSSCAAQSLGRMGFLLFAAMHLAG